jgi:hypothetical protein
MKKNILVKALSKNLERMSKSPWVRSLKDGKDLVCPYCDQPVKPCKSNPSAMCEQMLLAGTEGKQLEEALKTYDKNQYGVCLSCGKDISMAHLGNIRRPNFVLTVFAKDIKQVRKNQLTHDTCLCVNNHVLTDSVCPLLTTSFFLS